MVTVRHGWSTKRPRQVCARDGSDGLMTDLLRTPCGLAQPDAVTTDPDQWLPVSYNLAGASAATGLSTGEIQRAIRVGDLVAHYGGAKRTKPVLMRRDLERWIEALPTTPRGCYAPAVVPDPLSLTPLSQARQRAKAARERRA